MRISDWCSEVCSCDLLDLHFLPFGKDIAGFLNALIPDFGDVDKAVLAAHEIHESAEINAVDDLAVVDLANFRFLDNANDPGLRSLDLRKVGRADLAHAFVVNVILRPGFRATFAHDLAARPADLANLRPDRAP